jgi:hypothetical protein
MPDTPKPTHRRSIWSRFWLPSHSLEGTPLQAGAAEREAIRSRNDLWLKTYMDIYIMRWGVLFAVSLGLAVLATDEAVPGLLFALIVAVTVAASAGLVMMILIYLGAAQAVRDRDAGKR